MYRVRFLLVLPALLLPACASNAWRPTLEAVRVYEQLEFDLSGYFHRGPEYRQEFHRTRLGDDPETERYVRQGRASGYLEGDLAEVGVTELGRFLGSEGAEPAEPLDWPGPRRNSAGFFLEFDPPLIYLPGVIPRDRPVVHTGALRGFDRGGRLVRSGEVERTIRLEGIEDVVADGVRHTECVRLRTETEIRFHWGRGVRLSEYLWLAPGVGLVRKIENVTGVYAPFLFSQAWQYELAADSPPPVPTTRPNSQPATGPASRPVAAAQSWRRAAIHLHPLFPHPRVAGVIVEYE